MSEDGAQESVPGTELTADALAAQPWPAEVCTEANGVWSVVCAVFATMVGVWLCTLIPDALEHEAWTSPVLLGFLMLALAGCALGYGSSAVNACVRGGLEGSVRRLALFGRTSGILLLWLLGCLAVAGFCHLCALGA
jgi:hypothetical protein